MINIIAFIFVGLLVGIAMIYDIRQYRVPNRLVLIGLMLGLVWQMYEQGLTGVAVWFVSTLIVWMIMYPFALLRMFGAGDVKLYMVIGSFLGVRITVQHAIIALFVGAIFSIFKMCKHHNLFDRLRILASYLGIIFAGRRMIKYRTDFSRENKDNLIPFVVPMWIAVLVLVVYRMKFGQDLIIL